MITILPSDVCEHIVSFLDTEHKIFISTLCSDLRRAVQSPLNQIIPIKRGSAPDAFKENNDKKTSPTATGNDEQYFSVNFADALNYYNVFHLRPMEVRRRCVVCMQPIVNIHFVVHLCSCIPEIFPRFTKVYLYYLHKGCQVAQMGVKVRDHALYLDECNICKRKCISYNATAWS